MRRNGERLDVVPPKRAGEILVAKLEGAPWSEAELTDFRVVKIDAPEIEAQLEAQRAAGEAFPIVCYPFAQYGTDADGNVVMLKRSTKRLKVDKVPPPMQERVSSKVREKFDNASVRNAIEDD